MLICPEWNKPLNIESLDTAIVATHFWTFSGPMLDYCLSPITYLEETTDSVIKIKINDVELNVPTSWNILVGDPDTYQLDTIPIASCSNSVQHAVVMSPDDSRWRLFPITVLGFDPKAVCVHPMLQKGYGLQHPIGEVILHEKKVLVTVTISPMDLYKFIENFAVGDIF
jgi:hypothetical protein